MCGITGVYYYAAQPPAATRGAPIERMTDALAHRGPDDAGIYRGAAVRLGHRRLSILDVSPAGHQPMGDADGVRWIVFNGEIYNFRELRRMLEGEGRRFRSATDSEVVLEAYCTWGRDAIHRLNGMFAFAIWDEPQQQLWLARDPIGIKPLFYQDVGGVLRFGSEIKAILADPEVSRMPDPVGLDAFFSFGYVPAPHTGFRGIRQLSPGHEMLVQPNRLRLERYYRLPYPERPPAAGNIDEHVEQFGSRLRAAVERQMVSDVPLGAFLSGGLDSSAVVSAMRRDAGGPPQTFCAGFAEPSYDETAYARQAADTLGVELHTRQISTDVAELLPTIVRHAEEPLADNSMVPVFLLSQFARERVKVALSGDGGDELLAGYMTYKASRLAQAYRRLPALVRRGLVRPLVDALPASRRKYGFAALARRFVEGAEYPPLRDHCSWRQIFTAADKLRLYSPLMCEAVSTADPLAEYSGCIDDAPEWLSPLEQRLHVDLAFHLPSGILAKVDRMSMAHGLEVRVPLLDLEMIRSCLALPPDLKLRRGTSKYILKRCLAPVLPRTLLHRRKSGFVIPLERWMGGPLLPLVRETLSPDLIRQTELLSADAVSGMIAAQAQGRRDFAYPLFVLLVFGLWWRIWIEGSSG